jgi:hypothetical protein
MCNYKCCNLARLQQQLSAYRGQLGRQLVHGLQGKWQQQQQLIVALLQINPLKVCRSHQIVTIEPGCSSSLVPSGGS